MLNEDLGALSIASSREKRCAKCEETKDIIAFYKNSTRYDGISVYCKPCHSSYNPPPKPPKRDLLKVFSSLPLFEFSNNYKICKTCKRRFSLSEFIPLKGKMLIDGSQRRDSHCRECRATKNRFLTNRHVENNKQREGYAVESKYCPVCKEVLPSKAFGKASYNKSGLTSRCRICGRIKLYGLTRKEWLDLFNAQGGKCASCFNEIDMYGNASQAPAVDHDHKTGKVRGILCQGCNIALGASREDPKVLIGLVRYLGHEAHLLKAEAS